jgi:hypothetical protein
MIQMSILVFYMCNKGVHLLVIRISLYLWLCNSCHRYSVVEYMNIILILHFIIPYQATKCTFYKLIFYI